MIGLPRAEKSMMKCSSSFDRILERDRRTELLYRPINITRQRCCADAR